MAFGGLDGFDQPADMTPCVFDGALLCISHPMLDLGKGLFDRIEVRRIGRKEPEPRTGGFDQLTDGCRLMAAEIVHDDDVAWLEHRDQLLLDIGAKTWPLIGPSKTQGGCKLIVSQSAQECQRAPVAMRCKCPQSLAFRAPAPDRRHVGLDPGLINEDQPFAIEMILQGLPPLFFASDVGTSLLRANSVFLKA